VPIRHKDSTMTQFMLSVFHDPGVHDAGAAYQSDEEMQAAFAAVDAFNQELQSNDQLVFACGLLPPESATVVDAEGGQTPPPADRGRQLGGFWIVEVADHESAVTLAARAAAACGQLVEARQLQG